jgi:formylglycine-generating enzyme required for sulfatase activity
MRRSIQGLLAILVLGGGLTYLLRRDTASEVLGAPPSATPEMKPYTQKMPGSDISFDMVPIPGGEFMMGSPNTENGRSEDEGPQHPVEIKPFWMGKHEVTWEEYDQFRGKPSGETGEEEKAKKGKNNQQNEDKDIGAMVKKDPDATTHPTNVYIDPYYNFGSGKQPAISMTHHAAMEYCYWLSKKTGKTYRLPTEAEWEYAARAGTKTAYFFGDDPKNLGDFAWFADNSEEQPHKVGEKKPNPWGLYDIYGNVAEYCLDHYDKKSYSTFSLDKPTLSPIVMPTEKRFPHVVRGGSWADPAAQNRSASRLGSELAWMKRDPQRPRSIWWLTDADFVGFRVVCPLEEQPNLKKLRSKVTRESK